MELCGCINGRHIVILNNTLTEFNSIHRAPSAQIGSLARGVLWFWHLATASCVCANLFRHGPNFGGSNNVEVTKALAALQPLYGKDNVEIVTLDGQRVRGVVRSMKTTQALTTPSVKIECANGELIKIPFPQIAEIKDYNGHGGQ